MVDHEAIQKALDAVRDEGIASPRTFELLELLVAAIRGADPQEAVTRPDLTNPDAPRRTVSGRMPAQVPGAPASPAAEHFHRAGKIASGEED